MDQTVLQELLVVAGMLVALATDIDKISERVEKHITDRRLKAKT